MAGHRCCCFERRLMPRCAKGSSVRDHKCNGNSLGIAVVSSNLPRDVFPDDHFLAFITASAAGIHIPDCRRTVSTGVRRHIVEVVFAFVNVASQKFRPYVHRSQLEFPGFGILVSTSQHRTTVAAGRVLTSDASSGTLTGAVIRRQI